jgi:uncharacterized membrane protein HdeD (DUF308 family)
MSEDARLTVISVLLQGLEELRRHWAWYLVLGISLIVLGTTALGSSALITLATMVLAGWLMIPGGVVEAGQAFNCKEWSGFLLDLLTGILYPRALLLCRIR